ncbi:periplasmic binding protein-like I [Powellomyces hirtus]|nr:periplasmic binding protein-like I [Powellomyces hirtus]
MANRHSIHHRRPPRLSVFLRMLLLAAATVACLPGAQSGTGPHELRFHAILPLSIYTVEMPSIVKTLQLLIDDVNSNDNHLPGATLRITFFDTARLMPAVVRDGFVAIDNNTHGVIGEFNSGSSGTLSYVLQQRKIIQCSGASTSTGFTDKKQFPNFWRTIPADDQAGEVMLNYVASMQWKKVVLLASNTVYGQAVADAAVRRATALGVEVSIRAGFTASSIDAPIDYSFVLANVRATRVHIIVFCGTYDEIVPVFMQAIDAGIVGGSYVWVGGEAVKAFPYYLAENRPEVLPMVTGFFSVYPREFAGEMGQQFVQKFTDQHGQPPNDYSGFYYDCLRGMILAFDNMLAQYTIQEIAAQTHPPLNLSTFIPNSFEGVTGHVELNPITYDRLSTYNIFNWGGSADYALVATSDEYGVVHHQAGTAPIFYGGATEVPPDSPMLVARFVRAESGLGIGAIAICGMALGIIVASLAAVLVCREHTVIKSVSALFCGIILVGLGMVLATVYLDLGKPTLRTCVAYIWMLAIGLNLVLSSLAVKLYRVYRIFDNRLMLMNRRFPDSALVRHGGVLVAPTIVLMTIWSAVSPPTPLRTDNIAAGTYSTTCQSDNPLLMHIVVGMLVAYIILLLVGLAVLAFQTRSVWSQYNESRYIGITVYNILFLSVGAVALTFGMAGMDQMAVFRIRTFVILVAAAVTYWCCIGRHLFRLALQALGMSKAQQKKEEEDLNAVRSMMFSSTHMDFASTLSATLLRGRFPLKHPQRITSRWKMHTLTLSSSEPSFILITPVSTHVGTGILFARPGICSLRAASATDLASHGDGDHEVDDGSDSGTVARSGGGAAAGYARGGGTTGTATRGGGRLANVLEIRFAKQTVWAQMDNVETMNRWIAFWGEAVSEELDGKPTQGMPSEIQSRMNADMSGTPRVLGQPTFGQPSARMV